MELFKIHPECRTNVKVPSAESLRYAELRAIASWLEKEGVCLPLPIRRLKPARYERAARPTRSWLLLAAYAALWSTEKGRRGRGGFSRRPDGMIRWVTVSSRTPEPGYFLNGTDRLMPDFGTKATVTLFYGFDLCNQGEINPTYLPSRFPSIRKGFDLDPTLSADF